MNGNSKRTLNTARGTVMLVLLLVLVAGGIVAIRLIPKQEVETQRRNELGLRAALAEIRQAFDLKTIVAGSFTPDISTPAKIDLVLTQLEQEKLLRKGSLIDSTVVPNRWINGDFWVGTSNIPFNTSFEATGPLDVTKNEFVASWSLGTSNTIASTDMTFWPSNTDDEFDDYFRQNKFGQMMRTIGTSIRVTR